MSFDKSYSNRKDWRKKYYGSKKVSKHCRNHGNCGYCHQCRIYKERKREQLIEEIERWEQEYDIASFVDFNE